MKLLITLGTKNDVILHFVCYNFDYAIGNEFPQNFVKLPGTFIMKYTGRKIVQFSHVPFTFTLN